jgi:hypothetical protein
MKAQTMAVLQETICPGCGLRMPARQTTTSRGYYNVSDECWDLYTEVLATEYSNAFLFGQVHQLTVDSYAVQHAGGPHPDKSLDVHLFGLYLGLQKGYSLTLHTALTSASRRRYRSLAPLRTTK